MNAHVPPEPESSGDQPSPDARETRNSPEDSRPVLPAADVFLPDVDAAIPVALSRRIPGPGIIEACGWTIGLLIIQIACGVMSAVGILFWRGFSDVAAGRQFDPNVIAHIDKLYAVEFASGTMFWFVLATMIAATLRLWPAPGRRIGLRRISLFHVFLTILITLPLSLACTSLYVYVDIGWQQLVEVYPSLQGFDEFLSMKMVEELAKSASFPALLLTIAVAPAIAEEVIFRGVIGRGLVARWGIVAGIGATSILFGLVHIHPAHALAVMPLGMAMHYLYLKTRSFWAPMLLHFLNNGWATVATKFPEFLGEIGDEQSLPPWYLVVVSIFVVACMMRLFHETRVRYQLPDETHWDPGYPTAEGPPANLNAARVMNRPTKAGLFCAGLSLSLFAAIVLLG